jgi:hypothetical protein
MEGEGAAEQEVQGRSWGRNGGVEVEKERGTKVDTDEWTPPVSPTSGLLVCLGYEKVYGLR